MMFEDDIAAHLQTDRQLIRRDGERVRQQSELLDLLPIAYVLERGRDALLQEANHRRIADQSLFFAAEAEGCPQLVPGRHDQRGQVIASLAADQDLIDDWI